MSGDHLILIDASGFAFRAFYAWNPHYRESDGEPVGAVLGFMAMIWRLLGRAEADKPTHSVAVFDAPGKNFRHTLYPAYKANRDPARHLELDKQFHFMRHAAETLGLHPVEVDNFEADDVIATLATKAMRARIRTTIVSSDKDFGQLAVEGWITINDPMQRRQIVEADVEKRWGVKAKLVPHVQALAGDGVDDIPGINGVGPEKAAALIRSFGSVDGVLKNVENVRQAGIRSALRASGDKARLFLKLTTLRRNIPMNFSFDDLRTMPVMESHLRAILRALEAESKFDILFSSEQKLVRFFPHVDEPLEWWHEEMTIRLGGKMPEEPQCGFFKRKLVRGGPWVGARIWREPELDLENGKPTGRDVMRCEVGGKPRDPLTEWSRLCNYPCAAEEFNFEIADADHARRYRPGDPKATPHKPIDFPNTIIPSPCPPAKAKSSHRRAK